MNGQALVNGSDYEWYYRDRSQDEQPLLAWCATWPEARCEKQRRANFIGRLYFMAPDREAALREFRRWANIRMEDIPYIVLEQLPAENIPRCPRPRSDESGLACLDMEYRLC